MSMIRTLRVKGFKSLSDEEIHLGRVNCFIGANGVGKSNVLEAIGVLGAAANGVVDDESLLRRGVRAGVPRLYKTSFKDERTPPHISLEAIGSSNEHYRVSLLNPLDKPEPEWSFKTEVLSDGERAIVSDGVRNTKNVNPKKGLAALSLTDLSEDNLASALMSRLQSYAIHCPNTPALRGLEPDRRSRLPVGLNGGQLADGFDLLIRFMTYGPAHRYEPDNETEDAYDQIMGLIEWGKDIDTTTDVSKLLSPSVPRSNRLLMFSDRYMSEDRNTLTANDASEGALYVLYTAILCLLPESPSLFAIDNLDQALNPRLVTKLVSYLNCWLQFGKVDRQLLFTCHNPAALDGLNLDDDDVRLFAVDRNSRGLTKVNRITLTPELRSRNLEYPLSRLWMMGLLGAVPNV